jgi:hypothetical protein
MPIALLLAMQAAGMVTDYLGSRHQAELMNMGMKVQQAGLQANLAQTNLESADASLQSMKALRQTLGTQMAVFAARGTNVGAGSAASIFNESIGNFNTDERVRKMNLLGRQTALRGNMVMSNLQNSSDVSKMWQGFASRTFNRFPSSVAGWKQGIADFKEGFGLTSAGS